MKKNYIEKICLENTLHTQMISQSYLSKVSQITKRTKRKQNKSSKRKTRTTKQNKIGQKGIEIKLPKKKKKEMRKKIQWLTRR